MTGSGERENGGIEMTSKNTDAGERSGERCATKWVSEASRPTYRYYVRTAERVYNSVIDAEHFAKVRETWRDASAVVDAFVWEGRWLVANKGQFRFEVDVIETSVGEV